MFWLVRREWARWLWRHRRINFGQFCALLAGAPAWLERDTRPFWRDWQLRWPVRGRR